MVAAAVQPVPSLPDEVARLVEKSRLNWLHNNEVYLLLRHHQEFQLATNGEPPYLPIGGTLYLIDRRRCNRFRKDGHNWRKKKDGKSARETHERLKVGDRKRLYCTYVTAEALPLQRRCYSLLDCPELEHVVLVHYLQARVDTTATGRKKSHRSLVSLSADHAAQQAPDTAASAGGGGGDSWGWGRSSDTGGRGSCLKSAASSELALTASTADASVHLPADAPGPAATKSTELQAQHSMVSSPHLGGRFGQAEASGGAGVGGGGGRPKAPPTPLRPVPQPQPQHSPAQPLRRSRRKRGSQDLGGQLSEEEQTLKRAASGPLHGLGEQAVQRTLTTLSLGLANPTQDLSGLVTDQALPSSEKLEHSGLVEDLESIGKALLGELEAASKKLDCQELPPFIYLQQHVGSSSMCAPGSLPQLLGELPGKLTDGSTAPGAGLLQPARLSWHARGLDWPAVGVERQEQQRAYEGEAAARALLEGQGHSAELSAGSCDRGSMCSTQLLEDVADSALAWLDSVLPPLSHADDGLVPELPHWEPDVPLDAPIEREERVCVLGGAAERGCTVERLPLSVVAGVEIETEFDCKMHVPIMRAQQ